MADSEMKRVAVLIPTMSRPEFLLRTVRYYVSLKSPHPIYIGDASAESLKSSLDEIAGLSSLVVKYCHWPRLNDRKTLARLAREASCDGLRFVAFHGDDDYFVPESLSKCADFLDQNVEYSTAQGKAAVVGLDRPGPYGEIETLGAYWERKELNGGLPLERLDEMLQGYWVPQFSVHRVDDFLAASVKYEHISDRNWGEIYHCLSFAVQGKSKYLDILYLVRNVHSGIEHESFIEWISSPTWYPSYQMVCDDIATQINDQCVTVPMIQDRVSAYLERGVARKVSFANDLRHPFNRLRAQLKSMLPGIVYLRRVVDLFVRPSDDLVLLRSPKSRFYRDFLPIWCSLTGE